MTQMISTTPQWAVHHADLCERIERSIFNQKMWKKSLQKVQQDKITPAPPCYIQHSGYYLYKMAVKLFWRKELQGQIVALRGLWNVFKHFESAISVHPAKEQGEEKR